MWAINIERSHDANGADTAEYFTVSVVSSNYSWQGYQQSIFPTGVSQRENCFITLNTSNGSSTGFFVKTGTVAALPIFPTIGKLGRPLKNFMICYKNDVGNNSTITVTSVYGSTHSYIALFDNATRCDTGLNPGLGAGGYFTGSLLALLMRYE